MDVDRRIEDLSTAPIPRANGELAFDEPWQGRAFGMAVALHRAGLYDWDDFRERLIAEIAAGEADVRAPTPYYESWLRAFERLLLERELVSAAELAALRDQLRHGRRDDVF